MTAHTPSVPSRRAPRGLPALVVAATLICTSFGGIDRAIAAPAAAASSASRAKSTAASKPKPPVRTSKAKARPIAPPVVEFVLPPAPQEQLDAAERVYYGVYDCEFKQVIEIQADPKNAGYVEVRHAKSTYLMKPVLSSTGAIRLEDVRGVTLMVQIAQKSMLMDVKVGHRLVDECVSPRQRELMELARAKAIEDEKAVLAAAAAAAASAAAPVAVAPAAVAGPEPDASGPTVGSDAVRFPPAAASAPVKR